MLLLSPFVWLIASALLAFRLLFSRRSRRPKGTQDLPGPSGLPWIGSVFDLNKGEGGYFWFKFTVWSKQFGPIYQYKTFGKINVVVNTEKMANDLLRERGEFYSSRESLPMASQLLSDGYKALFLPYGEKWRRVRKLQHHVTQVNAADSYQPLQQHESARMVNDLVSNPGEYKTLFRRYASALILRLTYGIEVQTGNEDIVRLVYENQLNVERVSAPGQYLVDVLPILMRLPTWLAPFKQEAKAHRTREVSLFSNLVKGVEQDIEEGKAGPSFTRTWLENKEKWALEDLQGIYVLGGLYSAAASTTASLATSWLLMMVLHPEWFQKLQAQIDEVVGPDRLPRYADLPNLPLLRAVAKEVARMRPVTAGGIAHKSTKDDTYNGYFIPKGSIVHPNLWAIHHDPVLYPDPFTFSPTRWLSPDFPTTYKEPLTKYPNMNNFSVFGFGRRLCPGGHIAERSIYILSARMAWACKIGKATDPRTGAQITPPEYNYVKGLNTEPHPFPFHLECRSEKHREVLQREAREASEALSSGTK